MSVALFEPAPLFRGRTHTNPDFVFSSVGGRYILLGLLPDGPEAAAAVRLVNQNADMFDDDHLVSFLVTRDQALFNANGEGAGRRWFHDANGDISRLYGALSPDGEASPRWVLIDPSLRIMSMGPLARGLELMASLRRLPRPSDHAGVRLQAPVLIVPRVFELDMCRKLIALYEAQGGRPSGTMREIDGRTVAVLSEFKNRRDLTIEDEQLMSGLRARILRRLLPEIEKAFQFKATRIERYIVACYNAEEGGYFKAHRDNTTSATAHRQFAVTINLNGDYGGGDLKFPEFGSATYRAPIGGAVVFSCALLHEATKVTAGTRYAFLPFLYDDEHAKIRQENLHLLDQGPARVLSPLGGS